MTIQLCRTTENNFILYKREDHCVAVYLQIQNWLDKGLIPRNADG